MVKPPKRPDQDPHRFTVRWDADGFEMTAAGAGVMLGLIVIVVWACGRFGLI